MSSEVIEYHSLKYSVRENTRLFETKTQNGITCAWSGQLVNGVESIKYSWNFNWDELKKTKGMDIEKITGYIVARRTFLAAAENVRIDVELTEECPIVERTIVNENLYPQPSVAFDYYLTPIYFPKVDVDQMFEASDKTDAILVVEGKKIHVNKAFLSFHSDFFTALFSSNFKEGQMTEIPIEEVSYNDFGLLMSTIYPKQVFPNGRTAEKLLELADRFLIPFATNQVENYLLDHPIKSDEKMMWLADAYGMKKLLEKCIQAMNSMEKAKKLEKSEEYQKLSDGTKAKLFQRLVQIS